MCRVINHFGKRFRHTIVALDGDFNAPERLSPGTEITLMAPKARKGGPHYDTLSAALTIRQIGPDLLITHIWNTTDWAIANCVLPSAPHIRLPVKSGNEADARLALPRMRLMSAGDGAGRGRLERLASELAISDRVGFAGQVPAGSVLVSVAIFTFFSDTAQASSAVPGAGPLASIDVGDVKTMVSYAGVCGAGAGNSGTARLPERMIAGFSL